MSSKSFVHWLLPARAIGFYINTLRWKVSRRMESCSWIIFWMLIWILPLQSSSPTTLFKICIYNKNYCLISQERMQPFSLKAAPTNSLGLNPQGEAINWSIVEFSLRLPVTKPSFRAWRTWVGLAVYMFATIILTPQINFLEITFCNRNWMRKTNRLVL